MHRRTFLRVTGAALAGAAFPPVIRKALAIPAASRHRSIRDVEHVVFLMQENRAFDHYFGTLPGVRGFGDRVTIPLPGGRSVWEQQQLDGTTVLPYRLDSTTGNAQRVFGTPHFWPDAQGAWNKGATGQWPAFKQPWSMGYYGEQELGFQFALARAFTVCDAYFCSVHSSTNPNRLFMFTGTNGSAITNENDSLGPPANGYSWTTYPERLEAAGINWKVYQDLADNFSDNSLAGFRQYREPFFSGVPSPLVERGLSTTLTGDTLDGLRNDVLSGALPQVSWIVAPAAYSEHPGPSSPVQGAWYTQQVLEALIADPDVWKKTVLFVPFDENDGYFDHLPPPCAPSLNRDGSLAGASTIADTTERHTDGNVYGPGPRVPMIVVSPWSRGGWVSSETFDHTSLIRFLEERFGVMEPNISPWRRAVLGDLTSAFNFHRPNHKPFPALPRLTKDEADGIRRAQEQLAQVPVPLGAAGAFPTQPAGARPSRALPYTLHVDAAVEPGAARVRLTFRNTGRAGAVFHVYDRLRLDAVPRRYVVEPDNALEDVWSAGPRVGGLYDLWVVGPNGFLRHVTGATDTGDGTRTEARVRYGRSLEITVSNDGTTDCTFTLTANAYRRAGSDEVTVDAGKRKRRRWPLRRGWYDLTVTCGADGAFVRRFAGRVESGRPSITDPAMGT